MSTTDEPQGRRTPRRRPAGGRRVSTHQQRWKARATKASADAIAAAQALPARQYTPDRNPTVPGYDGLGLRVSFGRTTMSERRIELLRLLGRVYVADVETIYYTLYYRRFDRSTLYDDLAYLKRKKSVWHATVSGMSLHRVNNGYPGRPRMVVGLSRGGKQLLADLGVEPDPRTLELLVARDTRGAAPSQEQLEHDLQVTWWCMAMVEGLRLIPWCSSIYLQTEYRSSKTQRMDAVLVARFDPDRHRPDLDAIPWYDGRPAQAHEFELRWALELDNSTEATRVLVEKFVMYRDLHARGSYHTLFQGEVLLVLLVQTPERAGLLAAEFTRAWPEGWGLVSTPDPGGARATPFGPLWGRYLDMNSHREVPLLSLIVRDPLTRRYGYHPLLPYDVWLQFLALQRQGRAPQSLFDLEQV